MFVRLALVAMLGLAHANHAFAQQGFSDRPLKTGKYWIGVALTELGPTLKAQLGIETGYIVQQVVPGGPAAKAKLVKHDIIISANGLGMGRVEVLNKEVEKGKEVALEVFRKGKKMSVRLTPVARPKDVPRARLNVPRPANPQPGNKRLRPLQPRTPQPVRPGQMNDLDNMDRLMDQLRRQFGGVQVIRPGIVMPRMNGAPGNVPNNLSISISKSGNNPAEIHVKRGDDEWKVTEDTMDKLPADIRPHVQAMVRGKGNAILFGPQGLQLPPQLRNRMGPIFIDPRNNVPFNTPFPMPQFEQRFKELDRKLEQLNKQLEKLKKT